MILYLPPGGHTPGVGDGVAVRVRVAVTGGRVAVVKGTLALISVEPNSFALPA
jgi:hypothetical protein